MESKTNTKVNRGEVILFSCGEYSNFGYCGQVIFTKDCDLAKEAKEYRIEKEYSGENCNDNLYEFIDCLIAKKYCLPLDCREIYLGGDTSFYSEYLA